MVVLLVLLNLTLEEEMKFLPLTVMVKLGPPTMTTVGEMLATTGTGLLGVATLVLATVQLVISLSTTVRVPQLSSTLFHPAGTVSVT